MVQVNQISRVKLIMKLCELHGSLRFGCYRNLLHYEQCITCYQIVSTLAFYTVVFEIVVSIYL